MMRASLQRLIRHVKAVAARRRRRHGDRVGFAIDRRGIFSFWRRTDREICHARKRARWQRKVRFGNAFTPSRAA